MRIPLIMGLMGSVFAYAAPAMAQDQAADSQPPVSADIVVTAQRRVERAQEVPIAVTVVTGDVVERERVNSIADLSRLSASLQLNQNPGGAGGGGYIRGIGTFSRSRAAEPSVGIAVDGVVQGLTNVRNLSDIARVEVLRGPQGTLFGQAVSAGVINITTVAPTYDHIYGKASVELSANDFAGSQYGKQIARLALNVPLASNVAVRVSGYGSNTRGVLENVYNGRLDSSGEWGVRARLKADFGSLTANLIGEIAFQKNGNGGGFATVYRILDANGNDISNNVSASRSAQVYAACGLQIGIHNMTNCSDGPSIQRFLIHGYSGQLDYDAGPVTLTSITAYRRLDSITNNDIDNTPQALGSSQQTSGLTTKYTQFTQEFRAATDPTRPLSLTMGAFFLYSNVDNHQGPAEGVISYDYQQRGTLPIATCWPVATVAACNTYVAAAARNAEAGQNVDNENLSGFGEVRYKHEKFTAFAGMRVTSSRVAQAGFQAATVSNLRYSDTNLSWRTGVQYQFARDIMAYGTVSTGYKSAQIAPIQGAVPASIVYPEKPTSFELGLKTSLFNRRVNFNVDAFLAKIKGYQTSYCSVVNNLVQCVPQNISQVVSKGFEMDIFGRITTDWTVNATATYDDIHYPAGYLADNGTPLAGQQLLAAPKFAATLGTDYAHRLSGNVKAFLSFDLSYVSRTRLATISKTQDYTYKGHAIVGGRIGVRVDKRWSVAVFGDNLFGQNDPGSIAAVPAQYPDAKNGITVQSVLQTSRSLRQVGLQAQMEF